MRRGERGRHLTPLVLAERKGRDALRPPVSSRSVNKYLFGSATFSADVFTFLCLFLVISLPIMTMKHSLVFLSG